MGHPRPYEPPPEVPDQDFPIGLCTGRVLEHWHTGSMTRRVPELHGAVPRAYVEMNAAAARELGLEPGTRVHVISRRGQFEGVVVFGDDARGKPPRGTIFVPFFAAELRVNLATLDAFGPLSKQPDYKKCAVRVEKIS